MESDEKRAMSAFFLSSRRRHTRCLSDWSSDVCSSDLMQGPPVAAADVNGDGLDDVFIGGAAGVPGKLFIQQKDGSFVESTQGQPWVTDKKYEDWGALFFDANGEIGRASCRERVERRVATVGLRRRDRARTCSMRLRGLARASQIRQTVRSVH